MANTRISNLTASASNLASTDLAPVVQTVGVGPVKMTGLQLAGGLLGSTTFNGSTVTTSSPVLNLTQTWNAGAVTFTGLKFNATDTASASGSLLLDLQVGGTSQLSINKSGAITILPGSVGAPSIRFSSATACGIWSTGAENISFTCSGAERFRMGSGGQFFAGDGFSFGQTSAVPFSRLNSSNYGIISFSPIVGSTLELSLGSGLVLSRAAAATLQLGAADTTGTTAPTAQFLRVQSWSSSTNNNQLGADFTIQGSRGTGTGAGGSIIFQVAPAGSSGTAQNAYSTALTIDSTRAATFGGSVTIGTGNISYLSINPTGYTNGIILSNTGSNMDIALVSGGSIHWSENATNAGSGTAANGVWLWRDAANTLALRNGTNAQLFRVYSTYNGTNDAYGAIGAAVNLDGTAGDANTLYIGSQKKGSPTALTKLVIQVDGTKRLDYGDSNASTFTFNSRIRVTQTTQCYAGFAAGGVVNYLGTAGATDDVVVGTVAGDAYFRIDNKSMLFSVDNGATIPLRIKPSSSVIVGSAALATTATDGFLYIPTCAGTPTGTPTTQTGTAPIVYDTSNNKLYIYNGGWKSATFA